jgi:hypothetical protein
MVLCVFSCGIVWSKWSKHNAAGATRPKFEENPSTEQFLKHLMMTNDGRNM